MRIGITNNSKGVMMYNVQQCRSIANRYNKCLIAVSALALTFQAFVARAAETEKRDNFYAGKQIDFIVGTDSGGGFDLYARVLSEYMKRHIPGKPNIVIQYIPGSAGVSAAAHVYNVAARDGTVIAICPSSIVLSEIFHPTKTRFKSQDFSWVGTITPTTDVLAVLKSSGIETIEDTKSREVVIGATARGASNSLNPELVNALLGTKLRVVRGYAGGNGIDLAMERGEVMGRSNQWATWKATHPDWIKENKLTYLVQFGPQESELPTVPGLSDLVKDPEGIAMVELLEINNYIGRSVFAPPNIPEARLVTLRNAFDETMRDNDYVAAMKKANLEMNPRSATELQKRIDAAMANSNTASKMKQELGIE